MADLVNMPKLGFDMAEGTLVRWVVSEGGEVQKGEVLAEIETDKATVEVEANLSGVVHKHLVEEGTPVPVGDPIAILGDPGEEFDVDELLESAGAAAATPPAESEEKAVQPAEDAAAVEREAPEPDGRYPAGVKASPVARRVAEDLDIDLQRISGTGPGGRIVKADVEQAAERREARPGEEPEVAVPSALPPLETERIPLSKLRGAIGRRMQEAKQQAPHFYLTADIDAGAVMDLRAQANQALPEEQKLSVNDFIVKATALALREFPNLNASLDGDEIVRHGEINIGVAVAVENGLLTVVVRNADRKPLRAISQEVKAMASRANEGRVKSTDVEGSTFTTSNLGMFEVSNFIAIINPPETGILAVGRVRQVPVVVDGEVKPGMRMQATISADHRVTDGAEAARWLQIFKEYMEQPLRLLL
jgi:pyruvate dehydrogenase E2 component (dihydrolipoamide acetyltransferase)